MPKGTTVGFVCVNNIAAESTCKSAHLSGCITLDTIWAGADNTKRLIKMISKCDLIFATLHVYEQVLKVAGKRKKVINLEVSISNNNILMIKEKLSLTHKVENRN